jgi:hypothetical protein
VLNKKCSDALNIRPTVILITILERRDSEQENKTKHDEVASFFSALVLRQT